MEMIDPIARRDVCVMSPLKYVATRRTFLTVKSLYIATHDVVILKPLVLLVVASTSLAAPVANPLVTIKNGTVTGMYSPGYHQDLYLGIPFAQPPVGSLRFRNPQSINTTWTSPQMATAYGPLCAGYGVRQPGCISNNILTSIFQRT